MDVPNALYSLTEASDQLYFSYHVEENRFIYLNPAFIDFFDLDVQPTIPLLLAMVHPEDQQYVASQCEACLSGNTVGNLECRIVRGESQREQERHVLVTIADDGIGIPEKFHATLFERFSDARRTGLKGEPSTGLGMSIIKTIVEWHDGTIWFDSEEGRGSTFYIQLPK